MHPFYHIRLRNSLPSLAVIEPLIRGEADNSMSTVTDTLRIERIRQELADMGIGALDLKIWRWQFGSHYQIPIHTDGQRQSCINWRLTPHSVLDVFDREGGETFSVTTAPGRWSTHWLYPGLAEPPLRSTWDSYGPILFDPQQPHRVRTVNQQQTRRVTVTLTLAHSYATAYQLLAQADRIRPLRS